MTKAASIPVLIGLFVLIAACSQKQKEAAKPASPGKEAGALCSVGSIVIQQADVDHQRDESHSGRNDEAANRSALEETTRRARFAQAALDTGLENDPNVRAEFARILENRYKELNLAPKLKAAAETPVPDSRLREIYAANESRFRSNEKRQAAVLWLNPNGSPEREKQYVEKLTAARDWFFQDASLKAHPEQGFSVLSVDYTEHQGSRYNNGIVGWMESTGGMDAWSKAVAQILFKLPNAGAVSEVVSQPEGVFLVRYMAAQPAVLRPFESVAEELARNEQQQIRKAAESNFNAAVEEKYPIRWLK